MTKTAAFAAWLAGIVLWYAIRYPFERRSKKAKVAVSLIDRREWVILGGLTIGLFVLPAVYIATGFPAGLGQKSNAEIPTVNTSTIALTLITGASLREFFATVFAAAV